MNIQQQREYIQRGRDRNTIELLLSEKSCATGRPYSAAWTYSGTLVMLSVYNQPYTGWLKPADAIERIKEV